MEVWEFYAWDTRWSRTVAPFDPPVPKPLVRECMAQDESGDFSVVNFTYGFDEDELNRWHASSQYQRWQFSERELIERRKVLNEESSKTFTPDVQSLTIADEDRLMKHWLKKISDICTNLGLSEDINAAACSFFKRFYLANPFVKHDHAAIIDASIFLAAKTEHRPIPIDTFIALIPNCSTAESLCKHEMTIGSSIDFQFSVWHPHTQLKRIWEDLETSRALTMRPPLSNSVLDKARQYIRVSRMTDFEFIFHPVVIALASLWLAGTMGENLVNEWAGMKGLGRHEVDEVKRAAYRICDASSTAFQDDLEHLLDVFKSCQRHRRSHEKEMRKERSEKQTQGEVVKTPQRKIKTNKRISHLKAELEKGKITPPEPDLGDNKADNLMHGYQQRRLSSSPPPRRFDREDLRGSPGI